MYQPNFNNKAIRKRCIKALDWTTNELGSNKYKKSKQEIQTYFGNGSRPLGRWLRDLLLICSDPYYNYNPGVHICKTWTANHDGIQELNHLLGTQPVVKLSAHLQQQLDSGEFDYNESSDRFFNSLQYIPTYSRVPTFSKNGFKYDYDIQCAAPTLIKQYAQELGMTTKTKSLDDFLSNRTKFRQELGQRIGINDKITKQIINALLLGARIQNNWNNSIFIYLNKDLVKLNLLSNDSELTNLREDFKVCWSHIKPSITCETITDILGRTRCKSLTSKQKSGVYRKLERKVMKQVRRYQLKHMNETFYEHDGWRCKQAVDIRELMSYIKNTTGYQIEFDWTICEYIGSTI